MGYDEFTRPEGSPHLAATHNGTPNQTEATTVPKPQQSSVPVTPAAVQEQPQIAPALPPDARPQANVVDPGQGHTQAQNDPGPAGAHYNPAAYPAPSQAAGHTRPGGYGAGQPAQHQGAPQHGRQQQQGYQQQPASAYGQVQQSAQHYPSAAAASQLASDQIATLRPTTQAKLTSTSGVRGSLNKFGLHLGVSKKEQRHLDLISQIRTALAGSYWVPVISLKGGCGKTTTVAGLASTMARYRSDRVIAIDTNPDYGLLDRRTVGAAQGATPSFRDLVFHADKVNTYGEMRSCTAVNDANLEVLRGGFALTEAGFGAADFPVVDGVLRKFYNVIFADCGTALREPLAREILAAAQGAVIVTNTTREGVEGAASTIDWLRANGYEELLAKSSIAVTINTPGKPYLDVGAIVEGFSRQQRPVHVIPWDPHIAEGGVIDLRLLKAKTLAAYESLAASVAKEFATSAVTWR